MTYPKSNGKQWDAIRKREFDKLRKKFERTIADAVLITSDDKLTPRALTAAAWNCAFEVVTAKTE